MQPNRLTVLLCVPTTISSTNKCEYEQLASVVSDVFGKRASAITDHLLNCPDGKNFDFRPLLKSSPKKKADDIALAIEGNITFEQGEKMKIILAHMDSIEICKTNLTSVILGIAKNTFSKSILFPLFQVSKIHFPLLQSFQKLVLICLCL